MSQQRWREETDVRCTKFMDKMFREYIKRLYIDEQLEKEIEFRNEIKNVGEWYESIRKW